MRAPIRSESDAFRANLVGALVMLGSVVVGWISVPLTGVAAFVLGVAPASVAHVRVARADRPLLLREASHDPHPHGVVAGERHILIVAIQALSGNELRERILRHGRHAAVDVLAQVLTSHLRYGVSDIDR